MVKDRRYTIIKNAILSGTLHNLEELIEIITPTTLKTDLGTHLDTLRNKLQHPELFKFEDAYKIAELVGVADKTIVDMIHKAYSEKKPKPKRK